MLKKYNKIILIILIILFVLLVSIIFGIQISQEDSNNNLKKEKNIEKDMNEDNDIVFNIEQVNNKISKYIPKNIKEITLTNCLANTSDQVTYTINDYNKLKDFTQLFFSTDWIEDVTNYNSEWMKDININELYQAMWKINFIGDNTTTFNMLGLGEKIGNSNNKIGKVNIEGSNIIYNISGEVYLDILAFTNKKYYFVGCKRQAS